MGLKISNPLQAPLPAQTQQSNKNNQRKPTEAHTAIEGKSQMAWKTRTTGQRGNPPPPTTGEPEQHQNKPEAPDYVVPRHGKHHQSRNKHRKSETKHTLGANFTTDTAS